MKNGGMNNITDKYSYHPIPLLYSSIPNVTRVLIIKKDSIISVAIPAEI